MNRYTDFPRNTKATYIKTCAQTAREAAIRAAQEEQAYMEHTPVQNTDELLTSCTGFDFVLSTKQREARQRELGIDIRPRVAA